MTNDNKPSMFGSSAVIDPVIYEPRSGKDFWKASADMSGLAFKPGQASTILGNCTTSIPLKFDPKDNGNTCGPTAAKSG